MNKRKLRNPRVAAKALHEPALQAKLSKQIAPLTAERLQELQQRLTGDHAEQLVEANEQLVFAMLRTQIQAETTERKLQEAMRLVETDALTGLPNRVFFFDRFTRAIASTKRNQDRLALLFLDLNDFKQVNDTLGHAIGDEVLKHAAHCFIDAVREADTVCRLGGDEFLILLTEITQPTDAARIAKKVIRALGKPNLIGEHTLRLSTSIGISIYPDDGENPDLLIELADAAMYKAKRSGKSDYVFHGVEPSGEQQHEPQTLASLKRLVTHYELVQAAHERQREQLQEVNEQLTLSALTAQTLAEQSERQQKEALTLLAHELHTTLRPVRLVAELFGRSSPHAPAKLQHIFERQVTHLAGLLDDLLDISRIGSIQLTLERQLLDLANILSTTVDAWRPAMDSQTQRFNLQLPKQRLLVDGDPVRLEQIFDSLLSNACQYTPRGGSIALSAAVAGDNVVITLSDSGMGISAAALPHIFEVFTHDSQVSANANARLGIGLSVVRELVTVHGGQVVASSAGSGRGSQFVVTLPLAGNTLEASVRP